jgi:hypothetical protein
MPRVHHRKARKDYPNQGIEKGDMYFTWKIRSTYGGTVYRSKTRPKASQLTNSPFKSGWLAMEEAWSDSYKGSEAIAAAAEAIRELGEQCSESFENMPEGLQQGDTGQLLEERRDGCESKADELEQLASEYDDLEEPEKVDEPDDDEAEDFREKTDAWETYQDDLATYEAEKERISEEADGIIGDMPDG